MNYQQEGARGGEESALYVYEDDECTTSTAKITFKLCNLNKKGSIRLHKRKTKIKYNGEEIDFAHRNDQIGPDSCKVITIDRQWNTCDINSRNKRRTRRMSAQIHARLMIRDENNLDQGQNVHCYCKCMITDTRFTKYLALFTLYLNRNDVRSHTNFEKGYTHRRSTMELVNP